MLIENRIFGQLGRAVCRSTVTARIPTSPAVVLEAGGVGEPPNDSGEIGAEVGCGLGPGLG